MNVAESQVEEVFFAALEKQIPAERAAYLNGVCSGNPPLQKRVEQLLEAHSRVQSSTHIESPENCSALIGTLDRLITERPGTVIGPFKLLEQIGEGGFGVVFMAEQTQPVRRRVALKVIKPGMDTRQVIARFEAERQALAMMDHPHIAKVLEAGETVSGRPYFVMELVKGIPITEFCDQARMPTRQRLELLVAVCRAVQHAHQKGIIHRDLKPNNVLITLQDGVPTVKVIDFGIAKATGLQLTEKTLFTGFGQVVGTPLYMSPEQTALSAVDVDTRSDVYSLGVLLYELLTGSTPFDKETFANAGYDEMRRMICEDEPPRPSVRLSKLSRAGQARAASAVRPSGVGAHDARRTSATLAANDDATIAAIAACRQTEPARLTKQLRGELDWIVMKALEKDRNRRYESANSLALDLQRYLAGEPVDACPPSAIYRFRKAARKNKAALTTVCLVAAALVVGTLVSTWQAVRATQAVAQVDTERKQAVVQTALAQKSNVAALEAKQEADRQRNAVLQHLYYADLRLGLVDWNAGNVARLSEKLLSHTPQADREDLRDWEWYYLLGLCHQDERTLLTHSGRINSVAWSPDGRYVASACQSGNVCVHDTTTWKLLCTANRGAAFQITWSPDSHRLAWQVVDAFGGIFALQVGSWESKILGSQWTRAMAWSRDSEELILATDTTIDVYETVTDTWSRKTGEDAAKIRNTSSGHRLRFEINGQPIMAWSRDGQEFAAPMPEGKIGIYNAADSSSVSNWESNHAALNCIAWHPEGKLLASGGSDSLIRIWDRATGNLVFTLRGHRNQIRTLDWEPNGQRLVAGDNDGIVKVWSLRPVPHPQRLEGHVGGVRAIRWSPNQSVLRSLGSTDATITDWSPTTGQRLATRSVPGSRELAPGAGQLALSVPIDQSAGVSLYDVRSGKSVKTLKTSTISAAQFALSPDASKLALVNEGTLEVLDVQRDVIHFRWQGSTLRAAAWTPDGRLLAVAGAGESSGTGSQKHAAWLHVFDIDKRQRIVKLRHGGSWGAASAVAWSLDGERLVSGNTDGLAEVWELPSGSKIASAKSHAAAINALAWSPNGRRVASASEDGTVCIWDPSCGEELLKLDTAGIHVNQFEWSPNGRCLAAATNDGAILVWDATPGYDFVDSETYYCEHLERRLQQTTQLLEAGRRVEAFSGFKQLLEQEQPRIGSLPNWVGMSLRVRARTVAAQDSPLDEDITLAELLLRLNRSNPLDHWLRADALRRAGRLDEAANELREVLRQNEDDVSARATLGAVLHDLGRTDEAFAAYRDVLQVNPYDSATLFNLGLLYGQQGRWQEAIDCYRRCNKHGKAQNNLAMLFAQCPDPTFRDPAQAVEAATEAVKLLPQEAPCWNTFGLAQYRVGNWQAAIEALLKAEELAPGEFTAHNGFFLAMAHWQLGDKVQARQWFDQAVTWLQTNKEDEELRRMRAEAEEVMRQETEI